MGDNYITIEKIRKANKGKYAEICPLLNGKYIAFHKNNAVTGMAKTIKECIQDLEDLGYTFTESHDKSMK